MSTHTIVISRKPGSTKLILTDDQGQSSAPDSFVSLVNRGDTITWKLAPDAEINAITGIVAKNGEFNIFTKNDPKASQDGSWSGKVKEDAAGTDAYNINYLINGTAFSEDPEVKVNPPS